MVSLICFMKFVSDILLLCFILSIVEEGEDMRHIFWTWKRTMIYLKTVMRCCQHRETIKCKTFKDWRLYHESTTMFMKKCQALIYSLIFLQRNFHAFHRFLVSFIAIWFVVLARRSRKTTPRGWMDGWWSGTDHAAFPSVCVGCQVKSLSTKNWQFFVAFTKGVVTSFNFCVLCV